MNGMLSYEKFRQVVLNKITDFLAAEGNYDCSLSKVRKNDIILFGISILHEGEKAAVTIYLDEFYNMYLNSFKLDLVVHCIIDFYKQSMPRKLSSDIFDDYNNVKNLLRVKIVNKENNNAYLNEGPYRLHTIGAIIPYIELGRNGKRLIAARVTDSIMKSLKISEAALFDTALTNTQRNNIVSFRSIYDVMSAMPSERFESMPSPELLPMYILSNSDMLNGAAVVLYPGVLENVWEEIGDFFLLPSSIHETLIVSQKGSFNARALRKIARGINKTGAAGEEILGDEVYEFTSLSRKLKKCRVKPDNIRTGKE